MKFVALNFVWFLMVLFSLSDLAAKYKTQGDCAGYPRVDVKTAPGFCLGLVYEDKVDLDSSIIPTSEPRKIRWTAPISENEVLVTDMSNWGSDNGKIYSLKLNPKVPSSFKVLISKESFVNDPVTDVRREILQAPNQILMGPDHKAYVGTMRAIFRFNPYASDPKSTIERVISDIPGSGLHSLKSFTFDHQGHIYLNVGSDSNVCQAYTKFVDVHSWEGTLNPTGKQFDQCPEVEDEVNGHAQVRQYLRNSDGTYDKYFKVWSRGLRNSIGLVWDERNQKVIQAENGRDAISKFSKLYSNSDFPADEINFLEEGGHYGWPYCFANNLNSPEWTNIDCSKYRLPQVLLPAHSAPLGLLIYKGKLFPSWYQGKLIASLHGYESGGHRLVTFETNSKGEPKGVALSLVYDWEARGEQAKGRPVGLSELSDGSVLIVEDDPKNTILRLYYDPKEGQGKPPQEIDKPRPPDDALSESQTEIRRLRLNQKTFSGNIPLFTQFEIKVIDKECYLCHQTEGAPGVRLIRYDDEGNEARVIQSRKAQLILKALNGNEGIVMPPTPWPSQEDKKEAIRLFEEWLKANP